MNKILFKNRMEAINWIADHAENEGQFEVMREELNYNFIYTGIYYLEKNKPAAEVVLLDQNKKK